ncbi:hypothetical protein FE783_20485 [Paenibacillus mesophilus]|uniref:hypothetical protein n=1 Tax=Paenibacillus mesophilus TaxID=2582849 RepID=UPI00110DAA59|nr:hypothetical protein [Paenibacillus mesophilus]TMV47813.1 hypothetical protein FE783_20485 [Paenibacillus mesophilus]
MVEERRKHPAKRELTYRVGWKKGKFEVGENGRVTASESAVVFMEKALWHRLLEQAVWRKAPNVPLGVLAYLLLALPVISFGLTWLLVRMLSNS